MNTTPTFGSVLTQADIDTFKQSPYYQERNRQYKRVCKFNNITGGFGLGMSAALVLSRLSPVVGIIGMAANGVLLYLNNKLPENLKVVGEA